MKATADPPRFHHLDALRAFAMLLGLVLHSFMSFIVIPIWPAQDLHQNNELYGFLLHAIHGFRMPLFFLVSGFFTMMLWQKRGVAGLVKNRTMRIFVPLVIGVIVIWPMMILLGVWGGAAKANVEAKKMAAGTSKVSILTAVKQGDEDMLNGALEAGEDLDERDPFGITALSWAALLGKADMARTLMEHGADVDSPNLDGSTPLHGAAFLGRVEMVKTLLKNGAQINAENNRGETPLDHVMAPREVVDWAGNLLKIDIDWKNIESGRGKAGELLKAAGGKSGKEITGAKGKKLMKSTMGIWTFGAMIPFFHHLWFLYYLCLLVILFLAIAPLLSRLPSKALSRLTGPLGRWLWLIPLTFAAQFLMRQTFGPDTATGLLPWPPKLLYYAIFFGFGALCFGNASFEKRAGKHWPFLFLLAIPVLVAGLYFFENRRENFILFHSAFSFLAAIYAWLMIFGFLGFFRRFFSAENRRVRYLSDSAYWLYLAHLPLVMAFQILLSPLDFSSMVKLPAILLMVTLILLMTYEWFVRYSWIGAILNGRKSKSEEFPGKRSCPSTRSEIEANSR